MKIDFLCNDGSPLLVTERSINGEDGRLGVGGAELAMLTLCKGWKDGGCDVTLYNNPDTGGASSFPQKTLDEFNPQEDRDILIIFRSPNERSYAAKGKKVWFSTDQYSMGDYKGFGPGVHKIVTISPRHSEYFSSIYGLTNTMSIDLPVRTWEYKNEVAKIPKRCIFTSVPDRGLMCLHTAWPLILAQVPDATLEITSDYRLWGKDITDGTQNFRLAFASLPNVIYHGAVKRPELIRIQQQADLHLFTNTYDELFCLSVAESQVAGAYPVTSDIGALGTTNMGAIVRGMPTDPAWIQRFVEKTVSLLKDPESLARLQKNNKAEATVRFDLNNIINQWESKVFSE